MRIEKLRGTLGWFGSASALFTWALLVTMDDAKFTAVLKLNENPV
jgi:hypothetical protein